MVSRTNRDPKVVAANFLDFLKSGNLAPRVIRMDAGTENVLIANMQRAIRSCNNDAFADRCVIIGPSTANQVRIIQVLGFRSSILVYIKLQVFHRQRT